MDILLVRPSRSVDEAFDAARCDVTAFAVPVCDRALPAAVFDFEEVDRFVSVFDAFVAAVFPVSLDMRTPGGSWSCEATVPRSIAIAAPMRSDVA